MSATPRRGCGRVVGVPCREHAKNRVNGQTLQIRDVPEPVLQTLRVRAAYRHMSLAPYALEVLTEHAQLRTMAEVLAGPRLRNGKALTNAEILGSISGGRS